MPSVIQHYKPEDRRQRVKVIEFGSEQHGSERRKALKI